MLNPQHYQLKASAPNNYAHYTEIHTIPDDMNYSSQSIFNLKNNFSVKTKETINY